LLVSKVRPGLIHFKAGFSDCLMDTLILVCFSGVIVHVSIIIFHLQFKTIPDLLYFKRLSPRSRIDYICNLQSVIKMMHAESKCF